MRRLGGLIIVLAALVLTVSAASAGDEQTRINRARWETMTPEEKARIIKRYQEWKAESREQREKAEKNYESYQTMPQGEQQRLRERYRVYRELEPEKRERVQQNLKKVDRVPDPDMQHVIERHRKLRQKSSEEQMKTIEQSAFWKGLSEQDREVFRKLMFPQ